MDTHYRQNARGTFRQRARADVTRLPVTQSAATTENRTRLLDDWASATDWFVSNARREGHTPRSQQAREERLRTFAKFAGCAPGEVTVGLMKQYVDDCLKRKLSHFTINSVLRTVRTFYHELAAEGYADPNFDSTLSIKRLKEPINTVIPLTTSEIKTVLASFDRTSWPELRDYTMCCLMLETGLRSSECINTRVNDLHLTDGAVFVPPQSAKGRKARSVYFGERMAGILRDWMDKRGVECEWLFPSVYLDLAGDYSPLTRKAFEKRLARCSKRCGISVHAHQLRHTFAVNYLRQSGGDLATCARQMGHSSVRVTERYLNVAESGVQRILVQQHSLLDHTDAAKPKRRLLSVFFLSARRESAQVRQRGLC